MIRPHYPQSHMENYNQMLRMYGQGGHRIQDTANMNQLMHPLMRMGMARGMIPPSMHQGMGGLPMGQNQGLSSKEPEYSKPHRPMTLPEITGSLNPNAPEFRLGSHGGPMNGFEPANQLLQGMMNMASREGLSPSASPNPGSSIQAIAGSMQAMLTQNPDVIHDPKFQYMLSLQQAAANARYMGSQGEGAGAQPIGASRLPSGVNMDHGSPPQGVIGQPNTAGVIGQQSSGNVIGKSNTGVIGQHSAGGVIGQPSSGVIGQPSSGVIGQPSSGGIIGQSSTGSVIGQNSAGVIGQPNTGNNFLSQSQNHGTRPHSPMQMSGRPSSAPSQQDPGHMGNQGSSPTLPNHSPPVDLMAQVYQANSIQPAPIGGERKRAAPARPRQQANNAYGGMWGYSNSMNTGSTMGYHPSMNDAEDDSRQYTMDGPGQYDNHTMVTGDGDHSNMSHAHANNMMAPGMYGNGSYPMRPMFSHQPKSGAGDSQTPPMWNPGMNSTPNDHGDERQSWQSWNSQQAAM